MMAQIDGRVGSIWLLAVVHSYTKCNNRKGGSGDLTASRLLCPPRRVKGAANILLGGTGFFIDTFSAPRGDGILWLHGYGNVFEVTLGPGEAMDVESGGWIYKDPTVRMDTRFQRLTASLLGGGGRIFWNRFTGPGRVGIQSMYLHVPERR